VTATRWLVMTLVLLAGAGAAVAFLWQLQRQVLFPAPFTRGAELDLAARAGERLWLDAGGARVEAWLLPARAGSPARGPLIIYAHGNGELIDDWVDAFDPAREWGASVLLVEYPGYGRSTGVPSEASIARTMLAAYDQSLARAGVDPARVVGYGRSLGGGAICALARERPLSALVLESTFSSVRTMAKGFGLPSLLVRDPFDNLAVVTPFSGPVLLVHGELDSMIPIAHAQQLRAAAKRARLVVQSGCGHNDCPRPWNELREFLLEHGLLTPR